jgi:hypothetical protein
LYLVFTYEEETNQVQYISSAAETTLCAHTPADVDGSHPAIQSIKQACMTRAGTPELPFGTHRCSVQLYDEWLLLHYQQSPSGLIIGVDAASAANLRGFLNDIRPAISQVLEAE